MVDGADSVSEEKLNTCNENCREIALALYNIHKRFKYGCSLEYNNEPYRCFAH